jgi:hypothetical protein
MSSFVAAWARSPGFGLAAARKKSVPSGAEEASSVPVQRSDAMPNDGDIRKRVLLRLATSPLVIGPFLAGMTVLAGVWAMGQRAGFALFAGLVGVLAAAGSFLTQLVLRGDTVARRIADEAVRAETAAAQQPLDQLDERLTKEDKDPRPETALRDLRALLKAFDDAEAAADPALLPTLIDIRSRVNELFRQCVRSLEQTGKLWSTACQLKSTAARKPLLDQRERLIADIEATVKQLSDTLVGLQNLSENSGAPRELTRLREELDQSLSTARTVEERVAALLHGDPFADHPVTPTITPETKG